MTELLDFTKNVLEQNGALIDIESGKIKSVVPKRTAEVLHIPEFSTFTEKEVTEPGEIFLAYGSEIVERLTGLVENQGKTSKFILSDVQANKEISEQDIKNKFQFVNTKFGGMETVTGNIPYYIFNFRYSLISDERKDGMLNFSINGLSLARIEGIRDISCLYSPAESDKSVETVQDPLPVKTVYEKAITEARNVIETDMEHFRQVLSRRLERDIRRVEEYYGNLLKELGKRRKTRKEISDENKEELSGKEESIKLELGMKTTDLKKKYTTKVNVVLLSAAQMYIPSVLAKVKVLFKKESRNLAISWNPLLKTLEDITCEGCLTNTTRIFFCPGMHLTCEKCSGVCTECGKKYCKACLEGKSPCDHVTWQ